MNKCPVCGKELKNFSWYDGKSLAEWLSQCKNCNYMRHYNHGNLNLRIGTWTKTIRKNEQKKRAEKIYILFYQEIEKIKKLMILRRIK